MLTNLDPQSQRFAADYSRIQLRLATAQQQVSSGLKVQTASDAPDQISALLQLEGQKAVNTQALSNLNRVQTEVNAADNALTTGVQLLDKITQLAGQGLSSDTAAGRSSFARQIEQLQQQLVSLTSTSVEGRYIFDGGNGSAAPYQYNAIAPNGVVALSTSPATRQTADANGTDFPYAISARDIFDHSDAVGVALPDNIFAAIGSAITALDANATAGISTSIDSLHLSSAYLATQQTFIGDTQNRLTTAVEGSQAKDVSLKSEISQIRDADLVDASLQVARGSTNQQAALAAEAKSLTKSLFDYLA